MVWQSRARARARVWAGRTGCREHCHAFPESGSAQSYEGFSYCTLPHSPSCLSYFQLELNVGPGHYCALFLLLTSAKEFTNLSVCRFMFTCIGALL